MDKIKIKNELLCNKILYDYKKKYFYNYDLDVFHNGPQDIGNIPANCVAYQGIKENIFIKAHKAGDNAKIQLQNKWNSNPNTSPQTKQEQIDALNNVYKTAYDKVFLSPYNNFTSTYNKDKAYEIAKQLDVRICVYCNINYIYEVEMVKNNGTITYISRADFDHFLPKSTNGEYQVCLKNLVPSCQQCNRTIKGTCEFTKTDNLNPYELSFDQIKQFDLDFGNSVLDINRDIITETSFNIIFTNRSGASHADIRKADGNIKDLYLEERYQNHKDVVVEIINKCKYWNEFRQTEINSLVNGVSKKLEDILFPEATCEINKTSLGKLKRDIISKYKN